jgi:hypothetical protein
MSADNEDFCTRCGAEIEELATIFGEICDTCRHELAKKWLKLLDVNANTHAPDEFVKFGNAMASEIIENLNAPGMSAREGVDFANTGSGLYREGERLHFKPEGEDTRPGKIKKSVASPTAKHLAEAREAPDWCSKCVESFEKGEHSIWAPCSECASKRMAWVRDCGERAKLNAMIAMDQKLGRCPDCDGTGDVHTIDGQWMGECHCINTKKVPNE